MVVGNSEATNANWSSTARFQIGTRSQTCRGKGPERASSRDSPDESPTGINVRVFPALLQDRREVLTATSTSGSPNDGRGVDLAIFTGIWTHSYCRLRLSA